MKKNIAVIVFLCLFLSSASSLANSSSEESSPTSEPTSSEKKLDTVIVNPKIRAEGGSLSTWSLATRFSYRGGSVEKPLDSERPNVYAQNNVPLVSSITGTLSGRYRFSQKSYLGLGIGVRFEQPFHESDDSRQDMDDPNLQYGVLWKRWGIQNHTWVKFKYFTKDFSRDLGYESEITLFGTSAMRLGKRFTLGMAYFYEYWTFDKRDEILRLDSQGDPVFAYTEHVDYQFSFYPFVEYFLTKTINLRSSFGNSFSHERFDPALRFRENTFTQSFGVGISVTRDIFLYPHVLFVPDDLRAERTNANINATINIF